MTKQRLDDIPAGRDRPVQIEATELEQAVAEAAASLGIATGVSIPPRDYLISVEKFASALELSLPF